MQNVSSNLRYPAVPTYVTSLINGNLVKGVTIYTYLGMSSDCIDVLFQNIQI